MWTGKIIFDGEKAHIGSKTLKYKVNLFVFPLSYTYKKNSVIVNMIGNILGYEKNKKAFLKDLKNSPKTLNLEVNEDFLIFSVKEPAYAKAVYNENIIHLSPVLIDENGQETVNAGGFNRDKLIKGVDVISKEFPTKLCFIRQSKICFNKTNRSLFTFTYANK